MRDRGVEVQTPRSQDAGDVITRVTLGIESRRSAGVRGSIKATILDYGFSSR